MNMMPNAINPRTRKIMENRDEVIPSFWDVYENKCDMLWEMLQKIFIIDTNGDIPHNEVFKITASNGSCFATKKYKNKLIVFPGIMGGNVTPYYDWYEDYCFNSPVYAHTLKIDKDGVLIRFNSTLHGVIPIIHEYAMTLTHIEMSFLISIINSRKSSIPIGRNNQVIESIQDYEKSVYEGKTGQITSPDMEGVEFYDPKTTIFVQPADLFEVKKQVVNEFLAHFGIRSSWNKKGNLIEAEVSQDDNRLLFNTFDTLDCMTEDLEKVNKMYNRNWSIKLNDYLQYKKGSEKDAEENDNSGLVEDK